LIEDFDEAASEGDTEDWVEREKRIASTDIGRLLLERYEIEQELLNEIDASGGR
jgi:hypothetical protein